MLYFLIIEDKYFFIKLYFYKRKISDNLRPNFIKTDNFNK